jgi:uncharacterized protein (TIGR02145 family)
MNKVIGAGRAVLVAAAVLVVGLAAIGCEEDPVYTGEPNKCGTDGTAGSCKTVKIGDQTWMAENLNYKTASDSWCYDSDYSDRADACAKNGRLYTWAAARSACQWVGWKFPDTADWNKLITKAGGWETAGNKLKSKSGWDHEGNGTDEFGFSALQTHSRVADGIYSSAGGWWTATSWGESAYLYGLSYESNSVFEGFDEKRRGYSVRCIKAN